MKRIHDAPGFLEDIATTPPRICGKARFVNRQSYRGVSQFPRDVVGRGAGTRAGRWMGRGDASRSPFTITDEQTVSARHRCMRYPSTARKPRHRGQSHLSAYRRARCSLGSVKRSRLPMANGNGATVTIHDHSGDQQCDWTGAASTSGRRRLKERMVSRPVVPGPERRCAHSPHSLRTPNSTDLASRRCNSNLIIARRQRLKTPAAHRHGIPPGTPSPPGSGLMMQAHTAGNHHQASRGTHRRCRGGTTTSRSSGDPRPAARSSPSARTR